MRDDLDGAVVEGPGQRFAEVGVQALVGQGGLVDYHPRKVMQSQGVDVVID